MSAEKQFIDPLFTEWIDQKSLDLYDLVFTKIKIPRKLKKRCYNNSQKILITRKYFRMSIKNKLKNYSASSHSLREFEQYISEFKKQFA